MKVFVCYIINEDDYGYDGKQSHIIRIEHKDKVTELYFQDGDDEDNILDRNFKDVFKIYDVVKMAYEAGLEKEEMLMKSIEFSSSSQYEKYFEEYSEYFQRSV